MNAVPPNTPINTPLTVPDAERTRQILSQLQALMQDLTQHRVAKGELLFHRGDAATGFYVPAFGQVKLFMVNPQGQEKVSELVRDGEHTVRLALQLQPDACGRRARAGPASKARRSMRCGKTCWRWAMLPNRSPAKGVYPESRC